MSMDLIWVYLAVGALIVGQHLWRRSRREKAVVQDLRTAEADGLMEPPTLHPVIDPLRCMGSGSCATVCPEEALGLIDGVAVLKNPAACIGHGACLVACPVDAITLVFGTEKRGIDIPHLSPQFETNVPGLYIAGELGGMGLVRKTAEQGMQAIAGIRQRLAAAPAPAGEKLHDVLIVGAGPAGIAAGLAAHEAKMDYVIVEQEDSLGGAVYHYPRHKLTMTAPVVLPIVGRMQFREVRKETLLAFWEKAVRTAGLRIRLKERMEGITPLPGGGHEVVTTQGRYRARTVLLALGRRGTPRTLGVPGEDQPKVVYRLVDAEQYRGQHVLVVGGGDSAVEAAVSLSEQPGTTVILSYRSEAFSRIKGGNRTRLAEAQAAGRLTVMLSSQVKSIGTKDVSLQVGDETVTKPNDAVIVCAGGLLPTPLLQKIGIRFDTKHGRA